MNELNNNLTPKELYDLRKKEKDQAKKKDQVEKISRAPKKTGKYILYIFITIVIVGGLGWLITLTPNLPPTSMQNHSENSPSAHILTTEIPDAIQRHMLEHADGKDAPGIIIQYNCEDYECESELIEKLTTLVKEYPENVYLAPNRYDGMIILTKLGRRKILDKFDEQEIRDFIR